MYEINCLFEYYCKLACYCITRDFRKLRNIDNIVSLSIMLNWKLKLVIDNK